MSEVTMGAGEARHIPSPLVDVRPHPKRAAALAAQLSIELQPGHPLHDRNVQVLASHPTQDDLLVVAEDQLFLVHLTWQGPQIPPWPLTVPVADSTELAELLARDEHG
ncbi:hypothetical protein [Buchananella hordeovulneris]|uniref:hypothetical protein n=1 Tax=Buchananella hordeovulneris TaxID=52770 RepID=UPI001C9E9067|nr:hypothetical protein [Buchananella hordeovulneris]